MKTDSFSPVQGGTITSPRGFLAGAAPAGLKTKGDLDLGILYSPSFCTAAGLFTANKIKAAPVVLCQRNLRRHKAQALVVNSGCANAATGEEGFRDAEAMAALAAHKLGVAPEDVLVASTGVIGVRLPLSKIETGIQKIGLSPEGGHDLARAIMTTDTRPKEIAQALETRKGKIVLGGIAKGAGMIHPDLATMLAFLTTDAVLEADFLEKSLRQAVENSFNMITIDGDTSPNDTVLLLANGQSGLEIAEDLPLAAPFQKALEEVCLYLAKSIARDGEGASRLISVNVVGASNLADARRAARTVAGSSLVKAAVYGADPNWGRILAAVGRSGVAVEGNKIDLYLDALPLMRGGKPLPFDQEEAREALRQEEVPFKIDLHLGKGEATAWGCDLSEEYVKINSAYTT